MNVKKIAALTALVPIAVMIVCTFGLMIFETFNHMDRPISDQNRSVAQNQESTSEKEKIIQESGTEPSKEEIETSKSFMIESLIWRTYRASCSMASSVSIEVKNMSVDQCVDYLVRTRGEDLRNRANNYTKEEIYNLYIESKEK